MFTVKEWDKERSYSIDKLKLGMKFKNDDGTIYVLTCVGYDNGSLMALIDVNTGYRYNDGIKVVDWHNITESEAEQIFGDDMNEFEYVEGEFIIKSDTTKQPNTTTDSTLKVGDKIEWYSTPNVIYVIEDGAIIRNIRTNEKYVNYYLTPSGVGHNLHYLLDRGIIKKVE